MTIDELAATSYAPYSGIREGAFVESTGSEFYPGVRVENVSFPLTITAPQAALFSCISEGATPSKLYLSGQEIEGLQNLSIWQETYDLELSDELPAEIVTADLIHPVSSIREHLVGLLDRAVTNASDFPVSALLETRDGFITGVNIEFRSWQIGLCAERVALAKALSAGVLAEEITAIHLHTRHGEFSSPCGACRQVIIEHLPKIPVHIYHPDGSRSRHYSSDLLPHSFTSEFLKHNDHS